MEPLPIRLNPGDDLRAAIEALPARHGFSAGFVVSGIGSLSRAALRLAGADQPLQLDGDIEILSLVGSIARNGAHLHAALADAQGRVLGGHVAAGCTVRTTAEVLVLWLPDHHFERQPDAATGWAELVIAADPGASR